MRAAASTERRIFARNLRGVLLAAWMGGLLSWVAGVGSSPVAKADDDGASDIDIVSSVMWQPLQGGGSYIYPPGIPAVLRKQGPNRHFRIEQYFNRGLDPHALIPRVRGPWPANAEHDLRYDHATASWRNEYMQVTQPSCDAQVGVNGYRCVTDIVVGQAAPSGTVGISISAMVNRVEFTHPNSVFWIILPEEEVPAARQLRDNAANDFVNYSDEANYVTAQDPAMDIAEVKKHVVRITLGGNFSLGSGYVTRSVEPLKKLFPREVFQDSGQPGPKIFVVTAAHLFPIAYSYGALGESVATPASGSGQPFSTGYIYDLHVGGERLPRAAVLLARNVESDVALMQIRPQVLPRIAEILGVGQPTAIKGLRIASTIDPDPARTSTKVILGYPAERQGELVQRLGKIARNEYPTDDTSNFGPLLKFKLEAQDPAETELAEPGMSGGPVVDQDGHVVGLTVERPNDTNTLIALDFTSLDRLGAGFALDEKRCMLRFNPFDRILTLVKRDTLCDYGRFGSPRLFNQLDGEWTIQEVLGFAEEPGSERYALRSTGRHQFTNGHSIINGHAVINGHTIIAGHTIIRSSLLIVNKENLQRINDRELRAGYKLNPDSFRSFVPKGVRILSHSAAPNAPVAPLGSLILGTRESRSDHGYTPVYSIREFAIWLHENQTADNYTDLVCVYGKGCGR